MTRGPTIKFANSPPFSTEGSSVSFVYPVSYTHLKHLYKIDKACWMKDAVFEKTVDSLIIHSTASHESQTVQALSLIHI